MKTWVDVPASFAEWVLVPPVLVTLEGLEGEGRGVNTAWGGFKKILIVPSNLHDEPALVKAATGSDSKGDLERAREGKHCL